MENRFSLPCLPIKTTAKIQEITASGMLRRRLADLGIVEGAAITAVQKSPFGDPTAYAIKGTVIAMRDDDASTILLNRE